MTEITVHMAVSNHQFTVNGKWLGYRILPVAEPMASPVIEILEPTRIPGATFLGRGEILILDPRVVVVANDEILYEPRSASPLVPWVVEWLQEHPEWPRGREYYCD